MKNRSKKWIFGFCIIVFGLLAISLSAFRPITTTFATKGKVSWTNPPENAGKIKAVINGQEEEFTYNVKAGHTKGGYSPKVGDDVQFDTDGSHVARNIEKLVTRTPSCALIGPSAPVLKGTSVSIAYETFGAVKAEFDNGIGPVPVGSGVFSMVVNADIQVTLTVYDDMGRSESCKVTIFVL